MNLARLRAPMPLLTKELTEQAARKRTYAMRVLYAVGLFGVFLLTMQDITGGLGSANVLYSLGRGKELFYVLFGLQFAGICLFLPALMSGAIAGEKEHQSLALLLVTGLSPWEIVMQKYVSRLVPMVSFLLLSLPLLAVCYAYGGMSTGLLVNGTLALFITAAQIGALALLMSAFWPRTVHAFVWTYVAGFVIYFGPVLAAAFMHSAWGMRFDPEDALVFFPVYTLMESGSDVGEFVGMNIPLGLVTLGCLVGARVFLTRRAFVSTRNPFVVVFQKLDRFWHRANRLVGGVVLIKERSTLPEHDPIAWRAASKGTVGAPSHLIRILLLLELPVLLFAGMFGWAGGGDEPLTFLLFLLWPVVALILVAVCANAFVSERAGQTLDILLATPMTGRSIMRQKARGLRRLTVVLAVHIATIGVLETVVGEDKAVFPYLSMMLATTATYMMLMTWVSLWVSLRARSRPRAVILAIFLFVLWCALPVFGVILIDELRIWSVSHPPFSYALLFSPVTMVVVPEIPYDWGAFGSIVFAAIVNTLFYGGVALFFRALLLRRADRYLGRVPEPGRACAVRHPGDADMEADGHAG